MATIAQRRAAHALDAVNHALAHLDQKQQGEYRSYARSLPFMIHTNGLGQAAAFFRSKGIESTHYRLYQVLSNWLTGQDQPYSDYDDLLKAVTQSDMDSYIAAQAEALALMEWVGKFAQAFLAGTEEEPTS